MRTEQQGLWDRLLVGLAVATFFPVMVHAVDDFIHGNTGGFNDELFVLTVIFVNALYLFGVLWAWQCKVIGYAIVGLYALRYAVGFVIMHVFVFGIPDQRSYTEIAQGTPEGWAPIFLGSALLGGVLCLATTAVATYLMIRWWQTRGNRQVSNASKAI